MFVTMFCYHALKSFVNEVLIDFINSVEHFFDNKLIINKSKLGRFWGMEAQVGNWINNDWYFL